MDESQDTSSTLTNTPPKSSTTDSRLPDLTPISQGNEVAGPATSTPASVPLINSPTYHTYGDQDLRNTSKGSQVFNLQVPLLTTMEVQVFADRGLLDAPTAFPSDFASVSGQAAWHLFPKANFRLLSRTLQNPTKGGMPYPTVYTVKHVLILAGIDNLRYKPADTQAHLTATLRAANRIFPEATIHLAQLNPCTAMPSSVYMMTSKDPDTPSQHYIPWINKVFKEAAPPTPTTKLAHIPQMDKPWRSKAQSDPATPTREALRHFLQHLAHYMAQAQD